MQFRIVPKDPVLSQPTQEDTSPNRSGDRSSSNATSSTNPAPNPSVAAFLKNKALPPLPKEAQEAKEADAEMANRLFTSHDQTQDKRTGRYWLEGYGDTEDKPKAKENETDDKTEEKEKGKGKDKEAEGIGRAF